MLNDAITIFNAAMKVVFLINNHTSYNTPMHPLISQNGDFDKCSLKFCQNKKHFVLLFMRYTALVVKSRTLVECKNELLHYYK